MEGEEGADAPPAMVHSEFDLRFHIKWKNKGWTSVIGLDKLFVKPQVKINNTGKQKSSNSHPNSETN